MVEKPGMEAGIPSHADRYEVSGQDNQDGSEHRQSAYAKLQEADGGSRGIKRSADEELSIGSRSR